MKRRAAVLLSAYLLLAMACYAAAFLLRLDFNFTKYYWGVFQQTLPIVLVVKALVFFASGELRQDSKYYTLHDLMRFVVAATLGALVLLVGGWAGIFGAKPPPPSVVVIDWVIQIVAFGLLRALPRLHRETLRPALSQKRRRRTLIFGTGRDGVAILRALQSSNREFRVVGFVSSHDQVPGRIAGVRVYPCKRGWRHLVESLRASRVLVPAALPGQEIRQITHACAELEVKIHVIPAVEELVGGRYSLGIRDITIEDLLRRPPAQLDVRAVREFITGRRVLVTGGAGSIGSELCRQVLTHQPDTLVLVDQSELGMFTIERELCERQLSTALEFVIADVTNRQWMTRVFERHQPDLVLHAAAYKHVPLMESNPQAAVRNNLLGTKTVADVASACGVQGFVLISTDKVVRPANVMGATKFLAEKYIEAATEDSEVQFITVRFGNVLNSTGSVIPTFRRQIEAGGPVTVTHPDMERFFMTIPEASQLVLQAGAIGRSGDVFILEMGEPVKIVDLAKDMIRLSGRRYPEDVDIEFIGARPGEKLYEELFYEFEQGTKKVRDKIYCARRDCVNPAGLRADVAALEQSLSQSPQATEQLLWDAVARHITPSPAAQPYKSAA